MQDAFQTTNAFLLERESKRAVSTPAAFYRLHVCSASRGDGPPLGMTVVHVEVENSPLRWGNPRDEVAPASNKPTPIVVTRSTGSAGQDNGREEGNEATGLRFFCSVLSITDSDGELLAQRLVTVISSHHFARFEFET
ncbi:MAG: hypothetical protein KatS3mg111_0817 [Pirellulaceae bacterium]|nr:MAG: hypothetical protein KatS3mg111_0817 [Pirellulaceae bacterium]